jgi:hypothetical protein
MKIASFNINNIRKRLPNLLNWLREAGPDVVCLQELKATDAEFPAEAGQCGPERRHDQEALVARGSNEVRLDPHSKRPPAAHWPVAALQIEICEGGSLPLVGPGLI